MYPVLESMRLLMAQDPAAGGVRYEFRTTVVRELHTREDLVKLAYWIADEAQSAMSPMCPPWFIQNFKDSDAVLAGEGTLHPWDEDDLRALTLIREAVGEDIRLRVDANQGYNVETALEVLPTFEKLHIDAVEQCLPWWDFDGAAELPDSL